MSTEQDNTSKTHNNIYTYNKATFNKYNKILQIMRKIAYKLFKQLLITR